MAWPCSVTIAPGSPPARAAAGRRPGGTASLPQGTGAAGEPGSPRVPCRSVPPTEKAEEPPTEAERVIDVAIKKLAKLQSVAADSEQDVEMLNQKFTIKGRYLKAPKTRIYLSSPSRGLPTRRGTILQVCDGETLWDYEQVLESQFYRKLSIKPSWNGSTRPTSIPRSGNRSSPRWASPDRKPCWSACGRTLKFDQKEEGELDGRKVWIFHGTWKNRQGLMLPNSQPGSRDGSLASVHSMDGTLYLGKDDGWPYKLVLVGPKADGNPGHSTQEGPTDDSSDRKRSIEKIDPSPDRADLLRTSS